MNPALNLETYLPHWAKRTNALVQRRLSFTGNSSTLNTRRILALFLIQAVLILLSVLFRPLLDIDLPVTLITIFLLPLLVVPYGLGLTSVLILPLVFMFYGRILLDVTRSTNDSMFAEQQRDTLTLLRTTPPSLREILMSQVAGSIWRQVENIDLLLLATVLLSLPPILLNYMTIWQIDNPLGLRAGIIIALAVSLMRPILELVMAGTLGILAGMTVSFRLAGATWAIALLGLYFLFLNMPRLLPISVPVRLLVEIVLPLLLPILITWMALTFTEKLIHQE